MLTFLLTGEWSPDQVVIHQRQSTRRMLPEIDALIEKSWAEALTQPGVKLFDGPMSRWESWQTVDDRLEITLSQTSYKIFLGTNLTHPELRDQHGADVMANPVGLSAALLTHDGYLLMGKRNASVAYYPNRIHPFAGALEPAEQTDLFAGLYREFEEELHLPPGDLIEPTIIGIVEDHALRQPELIFSISTSRTRDELAPGLDHAEHREIWSTRAEPNAIAQVLENPGELTPVAIASLLLWSRVYIGDSFYAHYAGRFAT
jgi:8-oxo-dGTP pyrophosphatase MutT (NUDIX family)